ncbi:MAG TPA: hypothetical protein VEY88_23715 [Archangium sp.]|nr:hypothetical protein [Archangium sp.]
MKDSGKPPSVIHLSDRRETPKELPVFTFTEEETREEARKQEFWSAMGAFEEGLEVLQAGLLSRLIPLALPELKRFQLAPIREAVRRAEGLPEVMLKDLETRLGTYPMRVRQEKWLEARAYALVREHSLRGVWDGRPGDTGPLLGRELYLLPDGRLGFVEVMGLWRLKGEVDYDCVLTLADAELIEPLDAVRSFPLHRLLGTLRSVLWFDTGHPIEPPEPELEARRTRFMALVGELSKATLSYTERLRRAGLGPP